jgi:micrococcal nuclease
VDTTETVHPQKPVEYFGKEASAFARRTAEGKRVRLEYAPGTGRTDRYGRTLDYVYLEDGRLLNLEIIEGGDGHAYTRFPFPKIEEFRAAERYAREAGRGLWGEPADSSGVESGLEAPAGTCVPSDQCCKVCRKGQACGKSCISRGYNCRKGRGVRV